jgi:hypothetical protein
MLLFLCQLKNPYLKVFPEGSLGNLMDNREAWRNGIYYEDTQKITTGRPVFSLPETHRNAEH